MADEGQENESSGVKVVDRRRFTDDGDRREENASKGSYQGGSRHIEGTGNTEGTEPVKNTKPPSNAPKKKDENLANESSAQADRPKQASPASGASSEVPPLDFSTFIMGLAHQALILLGQVEDPYTKEKTINLDGARQTIDTIAILEEKTKGNLTENEAQLIQEALAGLQMAYVQLSK